SEESASEEAVAEESASEEAVPEEPASEEPASALDPLVEQWSARRAQLSEELPLHLNFELGATNGLGKWADGFRDAVAGRGVSKDDLTRIGSHTREEWFRTYRDLWGPEGTDAERWLRHEQEHGGRFDTESSSAEQAGAMTPDGNDTDAMPTSPESAHEPPEDHEGGVSSDLHDDASETVRDDGVVDELGQRLAALRRETDNSGLQGDPQHEARSRELHPDEEIPPPGSDRQRVSNSVTSADGAGNERTTAVREQRTGGEHAARDGQSAQQQTLRSTRQQYVLRGDGTSLTGPDGESHALGESTGNGSAGFHQALGQALESVPKQWLKAPAARNDGKVPTLHDTIADAASDALLDTVTLPERPVIDAELTAAGINLDEQARSRFEEQGRTPQALDAEQRRALVRTALRSGTDWDGAMATLAAKAAAEALDLRLTVVHKDGSHESAGDVWAPEVTVRYADGQFQSASISRIRRILRAVQALESERTHLWRAHGRPDPQPMVGSWYPTLPAKEPTAATTTEPTGANDSATQTPEGTSKDVSTPQSAAQSKPRPLTAEEQRQWLEYVVEREWQEHSLEKELLGEPVGDRRAWEKAAVDRSLAYLHTLQRDVVLADRGENGAPPQSVADNKLTLDISHLDTDRPVLLDHAPDSFETTYQRGAKDTFDDGSTLERHAKATGGTHVTLRGHDHAARVIANGLRVHPSDHGRLHDAIVNLMTNRPDALLAQSSRAADGGGPALGDGEYLGFKGADGTVQVAALRALNFGPYSRYEDSLKVKQSQRSGERSAISFVESSNGQLGVSSGFAPGSGVSGVFSASASGSWNQATHTTTHSYTSQETRSVSASGDSHTYVNDVLYDVRTYRLDERGRLVSGGPGEAVQFAVRGGFQWRVPDGMTQRESPVPSGLPKTFTMPRGEYPDLVTTDRLALPRDLVTWALRVAGEHGGLTPDMPALDQITHFFSHHAMQERLVSTMRGSVRVEDVLDAHNNIIGSFVYRVTIDHNSPATLIRTIHDSEIKVQKNTAIGLDRSRALNKQISLAVSGGPAVNFAVRGQLGGTAQISTGRTDSTAVTDTGQAQYGLSNKAPQGLYDVPLKIQVEFRPGYRLAGFEPPNELKDTQAALNQEFPAEVSLRVPRDDARQWAGWDPGYKLSQQDASAAPGARQLGGGQALTPEFVEPHVPRELLGDVPVITALHNVSYASAVVTSGTPKPRVPRSLSQRALQVFRHRASGGAEHRTSSTSARNTVLSRGKGYVRPRPSIRRTMTETGEFSRASDSPSPEPQEQPTGALSLPTSPTALQVRFADELAGLPLTVSRSADARPVPHQIFDNTVEALTNHPDFAVKAMVDARASRFRRVRHNVAYSVSKAVYRIQRAAGFEASPPRQPTPVASERRILRNRKRLEVHQSSTRLETQFTKLITGSGQVHGDTVVEQATGTTVVLSRTLGFRRGEVPVITRLELSDRRYEGLRKTTATGGGLSGGRDVATGTEVQQGWQASLGAQAGINRVVAPNVVMGGVTGALGTTHTRKTETGVATGSEHALAAGPRTHVYSYDARFTVEASHHVVPRKWVRLLTGNAFGQKSRKVNLGDGSDGRLVIEGRVYVWHPDALMPSNVRLPHRVPDLVPTPDDAAQQTSGSVTGALWVPPGHAEALLSPAEAQALTRQRFHQDWQDVFHAQARVGHGFHVADLSRDVLGRLSKGLATTLATRGTQEYQHIDLLFATGQLESQFDAAAQGGRAVDMLFFRDRAFRHEAALLLEVRPRGLKVVDIVDEGLNVKHRLPSTLSIGSGTSTTRTRALQAELTIGTALHAGEPGQIQVSQGWGALWSLMNRSRTESPSQSLSLGASVTQGRTGRKVRTTFDEITYLVTGHARSLRWLAPEHTAHGGVTVKGGQEMILDWTDARRLNLVTNGLEELSAPGPWLPPQGLSSFLSVQGMLDVEPALHVFAQQLRALSDGVLPDTSIQDLGALSTQLHILMTPDALNSGLHYQLLREGLPLNHNGKGWFSSSGEVRVRLVPGNGQYRGMRGNVSVDEERSVTVTQLRSVTESSTRTFGVNTAQTAMTHANAADGKPPSGTVGVGVPITVTATATTSRNLTVSETITTSHELSVSGLFADFGVPYQLELTYIRPNGQVVQVREDVGTLTQLHPEALLTSGQSGRDTQEGRSEHPTSDSVSAPAETAVPQPPAEFEPLDTWREQRHAVTAALGDPNVVFFDVAGAKELKNHVTKALDHAAEETTTAAMLPSDGDDADTTANTLDSTATTIAGTAVGGSSLTRPGTPAAQQLSQQNTSRVVRETLEQALSEHGYQQPPIHDDSALGAMSGAVTVYARAGQGRAQLLGLLDDVSLTKEKRVTNTAQQSEGSNVSAGYTGGAYPTYAVTPSLGNMTNRGTMALAQSGDAANAQSAAAHSASQAVSGDPERLALFRVPLDWRVEAQVTKHWLKTGTDALRHAAGLLSRGGDKASDQGPQEQVHSTAKGSTTVQFNSPDGVLVGIPESVARAHGLLDDTTLPQAVTEAYDHVKDLRKTIGETGKEYEAAAIRVERRYEELYEVIREADRARRTSGDEESGPHRTPEQLAESYRSAERRLIEQEIERVGLLAEHRRLLEELREAKTSAQEQLDWYQQAPDERDESTKPTPYEPDGEKKADGDEDKPAPRRPLADPDASVDEFLAGADPDPVPLPYQDDSVTGLVSRAESDGGIWLGGAVPPLHAALREQLKIRALDEALREKKQELLAAQDANKHQDGRDAQEIQDLIALRRAELAYLRHARADAAAAADRIDAAVAQKEHAAKEAAARARRHPQFEEPQKQAELLADEVARLHSGAPVRTTDDLTRHMNDAQARLREAQQRLAAAQENSDGPQSLTRLEERLVQEAAAHIEDLKRTAAVEQAALEFAQGLEPSVFPEPPLTKNRGEAERRALEYLDILDRPVQFEAGEDTGNGPATYTDVDGTVYDVLDPHDTITPENTKGEGLPLALNAGLLDLRSAGAPLAVLPHVGLPADVAPQLRQALAARLREDGANAASWLHSSVEAGNTWLQPEPGRDVFTTEDLVASGLADRMEEEHRAEFRQDGVLHSNVPMSHEIRVELLARRLEQPDKLRLPGDDPAEHDYDDLYLVPTLFAREYGVEVHVVRPGVGVEILHPGGPDGPRVPGTPKVTVVVEDQTVKALIPRRGTAVDNESEPSSAASPFSSPSSGRSPSDGDLSSTQDQSAKQEGESRPQQDQQRQQEHQLQQRQEEPLPQRTPQQERPPQQEPQQPLMFPRPRQGEEIEVPRDGWCQISSLIVGAPEHVRQQLGLPDDDPVTRLLSDPHALRSTAGRLALGQRDPKGAVFSEAVRLAHQHVLEFLGHRVDGVPQAFLERVRTYRTRPVDPDQAPDRSDLLQVLHGRITTEELVALRESWLSWRAKDLRPNPQSDDALLTARAVAEAEFPLAGGTSLAERLANVDHDILGSVVDHSWFHTSRWTPQEFATLRETAEHWAERFADGYGDVLPHLLAEAFGVQIFVKRPSAATFDEPVIGPPSQTSVIFQYDGYLHYNGDDGGTDARAHTGLAEGGEPDVHTQQQEQRQEKEQETRTEQPGAEDEIALVLAGPIQPEPSVDSTPSTPTDESVSSFGEHIAAQEEALSHPESLDLERSPLDRLVDGLQQQSQTLSQAPSHAQPQRLDLDLENMRSPLDNLADWAKSMSEELSAYQTYVVPFDQGSKEISTEEQQATSTTDDVAATTNEALPQQFDERFDALAEQPWFDASGLRRLGERLGVGEDLTELVELAARLQAMPWGLVELVGPMVHRALSETEEVQRLLGSGVLRWPPIIGMEEEPKRCRALHAEVSKAVGRAMLTSGRDAAERLAAGMSERAREVGEHWIGTEEKRLARTSGGADRFLNSGSGSGSASGAGSGAGSGSGSGSGSGAAGPSRPTPDATSTTDDVAATTNDAPSQRHVDEVHRYAHSSGLSPEVAMVFAARSLPVGVRLYELMAWSQSWRLDAEQAAMLVTNVRDLGRFPEAVVALTRASGLGPNQVFELARRMNVSLEHLVTMSGELSSLMEAGFAPEDLGWFAGSGLQLRVQDLVDFRRYVLERGFELEALRTGAPNAGLLLRGWLEARRREADEAAEAFGEHQARADALVSDEHIMEPTLRAAAQGLRDASEAAAAQGLRDASE
ncbi:hypothetical protein, partial [Streptomyces sp. NPDC088178]|uniref:hypothetical protein n=1 Tax=Streptomyces sp. NPDC088178 TaxID=3365836 RepID=UPI0037F1561A